MHVPAGWATDLEVLRRSGSVVEDRGDHVVVSTPRNPTFYWGNFLLVTESRAHSPAERWIAAFDEQFPDAAHVAIGLPGEPDPVVWGRQGLHVEHEAVLIRSSPLVPSARPAGHAVRRLGSADDWAAYVAADLREWLGSGEHGGTVAHREYTTFATRSAELRAELSDRGEAAFFGAFAGSGVLVATAGIVMCGAVEGARQVARFQHVATDSRYRRRGLAGHLLAVASRWAAEQGADRWEIHVDPGTDAHRLYAQIGFAPRCLVWQAVREPEDG